MKLRLLLPCKTITTKRNDKVPIKVPGGRKRWQWLNSLKLANAKEIAGQLSERNCYQTSAHKAHTTLSPGETFYVSRLLNRATGRNMIMYSTE
jgi:hypothetical protein